MKKITILCIAIFLMGCETKNATEQSTDVAINGQDVYVYTIDGCEYIGHLYGANNDWAAHKGNCKYCAERRKLEK